MIKTISEKELKELESQGHISQRTKQVQPTIVPSELPNSLTSVDTAKAAQAAQAAAETMQLLVENSSMSNAAQTVAIQTAMQAMSEAMISLARPTWTVIEMDITRDRNDFIKNAQIKRIE